MRIMCSKSQLIFEKAKKLCQSNKLLLVSIRGYFKIGIPYEYSSAPEMQDCEFRLVCLL